jgi:hypothetical protein
MTILDSQVEILWALFGLKLFAYWVSCEREDKRTHRAESTSAYVEAEGAAGKTRRK